MIDSMKWIFKIHSVIFMFVQLMPRSNFQIYLKKENACLLKKRSIFGYLDTLPHTKKSLLA